MQNSSVKILQQQILEAVNNKTPLEIIGSGSKRFLGRQPIGKKLDVSGLQGIVHYEPTELVITALAGTPLTEIEKALNEQNQILPFEPPHFGEKSTLGGTIASGLSGPRRPYCGSARDFVLGVDIINGKGEVMGFGGEVMKNVAGYDVSRLMTGSMGTLGVITQISIKVLPRPAQEITLVLKCTPDDALNKLIQWSRKPNSISASCFDDQSLHIRLSGSQEAIDADRDYIGGESVEANDAFWYRIREQQHDFFKQVGILWRISVPPATKPVNLPGKWFMEWGGAQRWFISEAQSTDIRNAITHAGGHATMFRTNNQDAEIFQPPGKLAMDLHQRIKNAFDPERILNPGRMYADL